MMKNIIKPVFVILLLIYIYNQLENKKCIEIAKLTKQHDIDNIYYMLYIIDNVYRLSNIFYIITNNTLLGTVRHKRIIPWDTYGSISILLEYIDNVLKLETELKRYNIKHIYDKNGYMWYVLYNSDNKYIAGIKVVILKKESNLYYDIYNSKIFYKKYEIFPRARYRLNKINVMGPRIPNDYLKRTYNKNVLTTCSNTVQLKLTQEDI